MAKKIVIISALCLVIAGAALSFVCFALSDFSILPLGTRNKETRITEDYEFSLVDKVIVNTKNADIEIRPSEDGKVHISYTESENNKYALSLESGVLSLVRENNEKWYLPFVFSFFSWWSDLPDDIVVEIPADSDLDLLLKTSNSQVSVSGVGDIGELFCLTSNDRIEIGQINASSVSLNTTNSGIIANLLNTAGGFTAETTNSNISISNLTAYGDISASTSNGDIYFSSVSSDNTVTLKTTNSDIQISSVSGKDISLQTSNGDITGAIAGDIGDYRISYQLSNGSVNLPENLSGEKSLYARTSNGNIRIVFEN